MFALAFLSAVSAENVWGDFTAANCKDREFADAGETKQCLNHVGGKWKINFITNWKSNTCAEYTEKKEEYCKEHPEFVACCGSLCRESTESLGCSANFGFDVETTEKIDDLECEAEEDTTCADMNEELKTNLKTDTMLECKENKCVSTVAPTTKDGDKEDKKTNKDDKKDDKKGDDKGNAFAMGLSTLAGALVLLQL